MIQAIGLTSTARRKRQPQVDDLTFEARSGEVTVLLGPTGSGKSEALRLMLQLLPGRGVALFRGRPVQRIPHPAREIGVLLGDVPGHPARTARRHLRMLTAVAGVPIERADEVLEVVGLSGLADQRLGDFSLGMDRRLGMAAALLGDPHTLVLDQPTQGLSLREASWLQGLLRSYAEHGGLVLVTARDPKEAARIADRVVSIDDGRLVADQEAADFSRTRLRPRVAVRTPHAERFAAVLSQEARSAERISRGRAAVEVVCEGGSRVSVYGSDCAAVGESAYRHGILVHQLKNEIGDAGDGSRPGVLERADGRVSDALRPADPGVGATGERAEEGANDDRKGQSAESGWGDGPRETLCGEGARAAGDQSAAAGHAAVPAPHAYVPGRGGAATPSATADSADQDGSGAGAGTGEASSGMDAGAEGELDLTACRGGPEGPVSREERAEAAQESADPNRAPGEGALVPAASEESGAQHADTSDARHGSQRHPVGRAQTATSRGSHARLAEDKPQGANPEGEGPLRGRPAESGNAGTQEVSPVCAAPNDRVLDSRGTRTDEKRPAARSTSSPAHGAGEDAPPTHPDSATSSRATALYTTSPSTTSVRNAAADVTSLGAKRGGHATRVGRPFGGASWAAKVVTSTRDRLRAGRNRKDGAGDRVPETVGRGGHTAKGGEPTAVAPPASPVVRRPGPVAPLQYELRRLFGVRTPWVVVALTLLSGLALSVAVARAGAGSTLDAETGIAPGLKLLMGWLPGSPFLVPPAAVAAGFLGATAFGQEFRYPALVPAQVPVPRRLGLLVAKLGVTAGAAVGLCVATALCNGAVLTLLFGADSGVLAFPDRVLELDGLTRLSVPGGGGAGYVVPSLGVQVLAVLALCVGCAWAGLLAAGVCRSTMSGLLAVVAVPSLVAPLVAEVTVGPHGQSVEGMPERLRSVLLFPWPSAAEQWGSVAGEIATQPVGRALALSLTVLFGAYGVTSLRGRPRRQ